MRGSLSVCLAVLCVGFCSTSFADGRRDLEDGIAFYENLDTERALDRLNSASQDNTLRAADRARALVYVGLIHFENGDADKAKSTWQRAFALDGKAKIPPGTAPKVAERFEAARSAAPGEVRPPPPPVDQPPPPVDQPPPPDLPKITPPPPPPPPLTDTATTSAGNGGEEGGSSGLVWVGVTAGVLAVAAAVVTVVLLSSGGDPESECEQGGGGCIQITFQ